MSNPLKPLNNQGFLSLLMWIQAKKTDAFSENIVESSSGDTIPSWTNEQIEIMLQSSKWILFFWTGEALLQSAATTISLSKIISPISLLIHHQKPITNCFFLGGGELARCVAKSNNAATWWLRSRPTSATRDEFWSQTNDPCGLLSGWVEHTSSYIFQHIWGILLTTHSKAQD